MRLPAALLLLLLPLPASAQDALSEARRLYNAGQYDAAERSARTAVTQPRTSNSARLVLGRILLERYRTSTLSTDLTLAREALRAVDANTLDARERLELMLGLGQALFFEDRFAAAADLFEPVIDASASLGPAAHDRALDWWASALDRYAASRPFTERAPILERVMRRMSEELARDPASVPANYWLVASAHAKGDLDAAWSAAQATWMRAVLARDRAAALRADLDKLVVEGIIPARAAKVGSRESSAVIAGMVGEWEAFKAAWTR